MKPVLIISAVERETALLELALGDACRSSSPAFTVREGSIGRLPVLICVGGVGKVNAAAATAALIERHQPRLVINTGCAGAYPGSGLSIGDLVVASCEILGDEGALTSAGWLDLQQMGMPSLVTGQQQYYNEIPLSSHAAEKAMQLADYCGVALARGRFVTVSTCSGSLRRGKQLARRFGAVCESMEGAAVALVCQRYGIDCLEIRGISNHVEERNLANWDIGGAVENAQRLVLKYLEELDRA
jgi:futalosine hydrolase